MICFYLSFMDRMFKCRLTRNMGQSKSNCLIPIPKPLKKWKDITKDIYGKDKSKLNAFKNWMLNRLLIYRGFWNCLCLYIDNFFHYFYNREYLKYFWSYCSHCTVPMDLPVAPKVFKSSYIIGSLADTFNSRSQTLLCYSKFNNRVNADVDRYTHTHTQSSQRWTSI